MTDPMASPTPEATRRATIPAHPVILADGRSWGLAWPTPRYRPEVVPTDDLCGRDPEKIRLLVRMGYPWEIERWIEELRAAALAGSDTASDDRRFDAVMSLAVALLCRAHDLTPSEAGLLLDLDDAGLARLVDAVVAVIAGTPDNLPFGSNFSFPGGGDDFPS